MTEEDVEREMLVNDQIRNHQKSSDDKEWWWRSGDVGKDIYANFDIKTEKIKFLEMFCELEQVFIK